MKTKFYFLQNLSVDFKNISLPLLICFLYINIQAQFSVEITNMSALSISGDSSFVELSYTLNLPDGKTADVRLQRKTALNPNYYQTLAEAEGNVGPEISSGSNKTISWKGPNDGTFLDFKLIANQSPEVEIITELLSQIDSNRMRQDLALIQGIRHRTTGLIQLQATQDLIRERFLSFNQDLSEQTFPFGAYTGLNIIGTQAGSGQDEKVWLIGGHYDTVDDSPGADDNGSAIVGMLEAARVLSQYQFEKRIAFVAWDLEEEGLLGSIDFVTKNQDSYGEFEGYLNFEMIGYFSDKPDTQTFPAGFGQLFPAQQQAVEDDDNRGNFITNVGNTQNSMELMQSYEAAANTYVPDLKVISIAAPGTGEITPDLRRSDHSPFWIADIPALMITDGSNFRNPNYHSPDDVLDSLDFTFMSNVVKAAVATIVQDARPTISASDEFFTKVPTLDTKQIVYSPKIKVFPNPAANTIRITIEDDFPQYANTWSIYNSNGVLRQSNTFANAKTINCTALPVGMYHLVVVGKEKSYSTNFIIQR